MRLTNRTSHPAAGPVIRCAITIGLLAALGACGRGGDSSAVMASAGNGGSRISGMGPSGDYPVVLGEPFLVDGTRYTPADTMSYDEVGYAASDAAGGAAITAAHKTLPLPSYIEITSLVTGKTILARVERRGPMSGERLVALSPGAQAQLGVSDGNPVRVRRVNPPETERARLRRGETAPERMETPQSLVSVLKRKLPERGSADLGLPAAARAAPTAPVPVEIPPSAAAVAPQADVLAKAKLPVAAQHPEPNSDALAERNATTNAGKFVIQAATFSSQASAEKVALSLGGFVLPAGKYFLVRIGPFNSRGQADAALAKAREAGYSDAIVTTSG